MTLSQHGAIVIGAGVARLITGQAPGLDPGPYAAQRFG